MKKMLITLTLILTIINVGVESKCAVLNVKRKQIDVKTAGAHNSDRHFIEHDAVEAKVGVRDGRSVVFLHAAGW